MKFILLLLITLNGPIYQLFFQEASVTANRLLVVSEPAWCVPCKLLDPHLKQLKKEGYDVHVYTSKQWNKAKPKPDNLPRISPTVPTVMYVQADKKSNKVVKYHFGGKQFTAKYMKRFLTK